MKKSADTAPIELGKLYTSDGSDVWRITSIGEIPMVELENIETHEKRQTPAIALGIEDFFRLYFPALRQLQLWEERQKTDRSAA